MKLDDYIRERRAKDRAFDAGYDAGRERFLLSQAIGMARHDAGMSQAELARRAHTSTWRVAKVENRIEFAEPALVEAVASVLAPWLKRYGWKGTAKPAPPPQRDSPRTAYPLAHA